MNCNKCDQAIISKLFGDELPTDTHKDAFERVSSLLPSELCANQIKSCERFINIAPAVGIVAVEIRATDV